MAILGFHFSGVYKEVLLNGRKSATVMAGEHFFNMGEEVQIYLSDKPDLFEGYEEKRIGKAVIEKNSVKKVKELTEDEATKCGSKDLQELKEALKKWYNCDDNSVVTYIKFKLELLE